VNLAIGRYLRLSGATDHPHHPAPTTNMTTTERKQISIGGLKLDIYGLSTLHPQSGISVLFLLHGRLRDSSSFDETISWLDLPALNARDDFRRQL
jgi:hypothetical protein